MKPIRIGTRSSPLALWQATWVSARLSEWGFTTELVLIETAGDRTALPLAEGSGVGLFTKEIQVGLLEGRCDVAVHSLKDLPTRNGDGLELVAVPERGNVEDVLLSRSGMGLCSLSPGSLIGTGSIRRQAQILAVRPDLQVRGIRGNVATRIAKLDQGDFDAIVLAKAGVERLGLQDRVVEILPTTWMLPAIGQGALGLEMRAGDPLAAAVHQIECKSTRAAVDAERALALELQAGCHAPLAGWARIDRGGLKLTAIVLDPTGSQSIRTEMVGDPSDPKALGLLVARGLRLGGACRWLTS